MPTDFHKVTNNAIGYLESSIDDNDLIATLGSGEGDEFPDDGSFWISIEHEILDCSGKDGDTLYLSERGSQSTIATAHSSGVPVELLVTAEQFTEMQEAVNAFENAGTDPDFNTVDIGGGYGSTGSSFAANGNISSNGHLIVDGSSTLTGNTSIGGELAIGGGYGATGATVSNAGVIQANGAITTDGALTSDSLSVGGGYGSTGVSISNAGAIQANGALTIGGTITAGSSSHVLTSAAGLINGAKIDSTTNVSCANFTMTGHITQPIQFLTVASGAITVTSNFISIDTEGAASADDLDTINGGVDGMILTICITNTARKTTLKNNTGNVRCGADILFGNTSHIITLIFRSGSGWKMISSSAN